MELLAAWIELYVLRCICRQPIYHWKINGSEDVRAVETLRGHAVSEGLMTALGVEYVRYCKGLKQFLKGVFEHWRKIDQPHSLSRQRLLTHQLAGTPKEIANALEEVGAASTCATDQQFRSLHSKVRQWRS